MYPLRDHGFHDRHFTGKVAGDVIIFASFIFICLIFYKINTYSPDVFLMVESLLT